LVNDHAKCSLPQLQNIHIETPYVQFGRPLVFEALDKCLRSRRLPLEDDGESGAVQALGHNKICALLQVFNWEGSLGLDERQKNAIEALIAGGLHIKFVAASKNVQVFKIW